MNSRTRTRLRFGFCLLAFLSFLRPAFADPLPTFQLDLQSELCPLELQQPLNTPSSDVAFVSDDDVLVYTVCRTGTLDLLRRDDPQMDSPNHLIGIIINMPSGKVTHRYDWPTRARNTMLRVTHSGDLLVVRDNLIQVMDLNERIKFQAKIPRLPKAQQTFINLSPAVDVVVVSETFNNDAGDTLMSTVVLDSRNLKPIAQWQDAQSNWEIVASSRVAVRSKMYGNDVEIRPLQSGTDLKDNWDRLWRNERGSGLSRPLFLGDDSFAFLAPGSIQIFSATAALVGSIRCENGIGKLAAARKTNTVAFLCIDPGSARLNSDGNLPKRIEVYANIYERTSGKRPVLTRLHLYTPLDFGIALSPSGGRIAFVDRLQLTVNATNL